MRGASTMSASRLGACRWLRKYAAETKTMIILPRLDRETLTRAHVTLCTLEAELRKDSARDEEADLLAYVDLIILALRNRCAAKEKDRDGR
jgi:hypothetical protein